MRRILQNLHAFALALKLSFGVRRASWPGILQIAATLFLIPYYGLAYANSLMDCSIVIDQIIRQEASCGNADGAIRLEMAGNNQDYTYTWSPNLGNGSANEKTDLPARTYQLTITDANDPSCSISRAITLGNSDGPAFNLLTTRSICGESNGTAQFIPNSLLYQWNDGQTAALRADLAPGRYQVTISEQGAHCFDVTEVLIKEESALEIAVNIDTEASCGQANGVATVSVSGGSGIYSYSWGSGPTMGNLAAGVHSLTVIDDITKCEKAISFGMTESVVSATINLNGNPQVSCRGSSDATADFDISFDPGFVTPSNTEIRDADDQVVANGSLGIGWYCILVFDGNNCLAGQSCFEIIPPDPIEVVLGITAADCTTGGAINVSAKGGHGGIRYDWADLPGSVNINNRANLLPGTYQLTISDRGGCEVGLDDLEVGDDCAPVCEAEGGTISTNGPTTVCVDDGLADLVDFNVSGNAGPGFTYLIIDPAGIILSIDDTPPFDFEGTGGGDVEVYGVAYDNTLTGLGTGNNSNDLGGCFDLSNSINIEKLAGQDCPNNCTPPVISDIIRNSASCGLPNGSILLDMADDPDLYTYTWQPDVSNSELADNIPGGNYSVTVTDPSQPNCFTEAFIQLSDTPGPQPSWTTSSATCGANNGSISLSPADYTYEWSDGFVGADRSNLPADSYTIDVTDDNTNCTIQITVVLDQDNPLVLDVNIDAPPTCNGNDGTATILVSGGSGDYSFSWGNSATQGNLSAGSYTVTVTDIVTDCEKEITFSLTANVGGVAVNYDPIVEISCFGANDGELDFSLQPEPDFEGPAITEIVDAQGTIFNNGQLSPGNYCLRVRDANGCLAEEVCFEVIEPAVIQSSASIIHKDCNILGAIDLSVSGGSGNFSFDWADLPGSNDPEDRSNLAPATYSVTITDGSGCTKVEDNLVVDDLCGQSCSEPVVAHITAVATSCGNTSGSINIEMVGSNTNFVYNWSPSVSTSNLANNLAAGLYQITISDINDLSCSITETIIVNNTDGPMAEILSTTPTTCQQANGTAVLSPGVYSYTWCNGSIGANVGGLPSGSCFVTVTDPATNCTNVVEVVIGETSPVMVTVDIAQQPSCQQFDGEVNIIVNGGSASYSYLWSDNGSTAASRNNLPAGNYTVTVTDDGAIGCVEVISFVLTDDVVQAQVSILSSPIATSCVGVNDGQVQFGITPDPGFILPASSEIVNSQGQIQTNGQLAPGSYCILIRDGSGCVAGSDCFEVEEAERIDLSIGVSPRDCNVGGAIEVAVSGGTGNYTFDWLDLVGSNDPQNRSNLLPGVYALLVTDDNGCTSTSGNILVANVCVPCPVNTDAILSVVINDNSTYCAELESCFDANGTTFSLLDGTTAGSSLYGSFTLDNEGCLTYNANATPGIRIDTVCIVATYNGLNDTTCLFVNIYDSPFYSLATDTLYISTFENQQVDTCLPTIALPNPFSVTNPWFDPLQGTGTLSFDPQDNCFSFLPDPGQIGQYIDTMGLVLCDINNVCDSFVIIVSVLPANCDGIIVPEIISGTTEDCVNGLDVCLDIELIDIINYSLQLDGLPYGAGFAGCDFDTSLRYELQVLLDAAPVGPYELLSWSVNGTPFNLATFQNLAELVIFMNVNDPAGSWQLVGATITGGNTSNTYGALMIRQQISMIEVNIELSSLEVPKGTQIMVDTGSHQLVITDLSNGCMDTLLIEALCQDCPELYSGPDSLILADCNGTAPLCIELAAIDLPDYTITDNGVLYIGQYDPCAFEDLNLYAYGAFVQPDSYSADSWIVNGSPVNLGPFTTPQELVDAMNAFDPGGNWQISGLFIVGGQAGNSYGNLVVTLNGQTLADITPLTQSTPTSLALLLEEGTHEVVITNMRSSCTDTINVEVICSGEFAADTLLVIKEGHTDTLCVDVSTLPAALDTIYNDCPALSGINAEVELIDSTNCIAVTGLEIGQDSACIVYCGGGQCDTLLIAIEVVPLETDTVNLTIEVDENGQYCLDTTELAGTVDTLFTICPGAFGSFASFSAAADSFCIDYLGLSEGTDTSCWVICDEGGFCDTTIVIANVVESTIKPPVAVDDEANTFLNQPVVIDVLANDTLNGTIIDLFVIMLPLHGQTEINPDFTITYLPNPNVCNVVDTFAYILETVGGQDTAIVTVEVLCDELRIFSGFSPNEDGVNDTYVILGIENFPDNEVHIFNRWGNEVFSRRGYTNTDAWDGNWNGENLPDGTYFYVIKDGNGNTYSGYVQLHR